MICLLTNLTSIKIDQPRWRNSETNPQEANEKREREIQTEKLEGENVHGLTCERMEVQSLCKSSKQLRGAVEETE